MFEKIVQGRVLFMGAFGMGLAHKFRATFMQPLGCTSQNTDKGRTQGTWLWEFKPTSAGMEELTLWSTQLSSPTTLMGDASP